ncbi:hypothetical protein MBLNU13_g05219t1 [Cladosporium sp. NU13]
MQSYHFPKLTLPDDIGEVSAQHPITLERLRKINEKASAPVKRRQYLPSSDRNINISMVEALYDQLDTMNPPQTPSSIDLESFLNEEVRQFVAQMDASSPFVSHIMESLNDIVATIMRPKTAEGATTAEIADIHRLSIKEASHAIRRIYTAWSKYPQAGGVLEDAKIESIDYRYSATNAVEGHPESLPFKIAIFMGNKIDPQDFEFQTVLHEQKRIKDCFDAMKQTYKIWQTRLDPPRSLSGDALQVELTSEDATPITYIMQPPLGDAPFLTKPRTTAEMMGAAAQAEQAEYEIHDDVRVYVSGGRVLQNQAEKRSDLAQQLDAIRKAEAKEAKEAKKAKKAADKLAASEAKGRNKKKGIFVSSSDQEDDEEQPAPKPGCKAPKSTTRRRPVSDVEDDANDIVERKTSKTTSRKRRAADEEEDGNDAETPKKTSVPLKKAKKAVTKDDSNDGSSDRASNGSNDGSSDAPPQYPGTVAPDISKRGGAAPKWLRDEDNFGKQLVMDNPSWPMPEVYREFNRRLANTPYQTEKMDTHDYRSDWIEFPRRDADGNNINDKTARKNDICWRTYESVRQHLEKHKAKVNNDNVVKPFTWPQITENPAAHLPKREPPPRPTYYKDGTTLIAQPKKKSFAAEASTELTPRAGLQGNKRVKTSDWTPINNPFDFKSSPMDSSPAPRKRRAPKEKPQKDQPQINSSEFANPVVFMQPETPDNPRNLRSAPGDDYVDDLEDFVGQQSDDEESASGDDSADDLQRLVMDQSDDEDEGEEPTQGQPDGPADGKQSAQTQQGTARRRHVSHVPPTSLSRSQGLPSGWTSHVVTELGSNYNRTYYLDHHNQRTTWLNPISPGYSTSAAFEGSNASAPRYPPGYVWVNDQHIPRADVGVGTSGPHSDLAISNLPMPEHRSLRAPSGPTTRRTAAAAATGARRTSAFTPSATALSAERPSKVVKLPFKGRSSAAKKLKKDDDADD